MDVKFLCPKCGEKTLSFENLRKRGDEDIICPGCGAVAYEKDPQWLIEGQSPRTQIKEETSVEI